MTTATQNCDLSIPHPRVKASARRKKKIRIRTPCIEIAEVQNYGNNGHIAIALIARSAIIFGSSSSVGRRHGQQSSSLWHDINRNFVDHDSLTVEGQVYRRPLVFHTPQTAGNTLLLLLLSRLLDYVINAGTIRLQAHVLCLDSCLLQNVTNIAAANNKADNV